MLFGGISKCYDDAKREEKAIWKTLQIVQRYPLVSDKVLQGLSEIKTASKKQEHNQTRRTINLIKYQKNSDDITRGARYFNIERMYLVTFGSVHC